MYIKKIRYTDYDGNERTEEFCFNLSKAELVKFLTTNGDYTLDKLLMRLRDEKNGREIIKIFEELVYISYGKRSLDGRRLDKSEETKRDFLETEAYSTFFYELVTDAKKASEFVNGIIPRDLAEQVRKEMEKHPNEDWSDLKELNSESLIESKKE